MGSRHPDLWARVHAELGAPQRLVVKRTQLLAFGLGRGQITRALDRGRLHGIHRGVYGLVPLRALPPLALEQAALLAAGPTAVLSHRSAARLHGLTAPSAPSRRIELTAEQDRRVPGIVIHRSVHPLDRRDRHRVGRLATTSVARTVCDLERRAGDRALERLVDEALRLTSRAKLLETATRMRRTRVVGLLDPTRPSSDTWSEGEERLLGLIRESGLPAPEANAELLGYRPDLLWREQRVIVEYDSLDFHTGPGVFHADRERHNALAAAGFTVLHVTRRILAEHPHRALVWIAGVLAVAD